MLMVNMIVIRNKNMNSLFRVTLPTLILPSDPNVFMES